MMLAYSAMCSVSLAGTFPEAVVSAPPIAVSSCHPAQIMVAAHDCPGVVAAIISGPIKALVEPAYLSACACCDDAVPIMTVANDCVDTRVVFQAHRIIATVGTGE